MYILNLFLFQASTNTYMIVMADLSDKGHSQGNCHLALFTVIDYCY